MLMLFAISLPLILLLNLLLYRLAKLLQEERWQFICSIPRRKNTAGGVDEWEAINLSYYGLIIATATAIAIAVFWFLSASLGISTAYTLIISLTVLSLSVAASKLIASLVEKKQNTFTVAGAASAGLYLMPLVFFLFIFLNRLSDNRFTLLQPGGADTDTATALLLPLMAALAIAYIIGEGIGRLACLSFGCCYGKPIGALKQGSVSQRLFSAFPTVFSGKNKKACYASQLEGVALVPVQLLSCLVFVNIGIVGIILFWNGYFATAFIISAFCALIWRVLSEFMRADHRGEESPAGLSAYQQLNLLNIFFCVLMLVLLPGSGEIAVNKGIGLQAMMQVDTILLFQLVWLAMFLYFGISRVSSARLRFLVEQEKI